MTLRVQQDYRRTWQFEPILMVEPMSPSPKPSKNGRTRVLVVDDDPLVRNLLSAVLEDASFDLDEAVNGEDALRIAAKRPPDVVVLDIMMPGVDGFEVCRALRADHAYDATRIVMLTAKVSPVARDEAFRAGADSYFTKPFSPLDLIDTVLGRKNHGAA
jgi:DNA-binding response OmpR family regulator